MSTPDPQSPPPPSPWRWGVCLLLMLATVINYMDRMALNQMALRIKTYFDLSNTEYSLLESLFSFAFAIGAFTTGYIVDRISVRWVYPLMVLGWSVAGVLTGFANATRTGRGPSAVFADISKPYRSTPVIFAEATSIAFEKALQ